MRVVFTIHDQYVNIDGAGPKLLKKLEACTSYLVAGHRFSPAFRARRWDGREHLLVFKRGRYRAPIGLLPDMRRKLEELNIEYAVRRKKSRKPERIGHEWNDEIVLRDYQRDAIEGFIAKPEPARGILKMPIRSGKTKTAAGVIHRLGVRAIFLVPSKMLLHQTADSLAEALPATTIGRIGDGEFSEGDVTVATVQTLTRLRGGEAQCQGNVERDDYGKKIGHKGKAACGKAKCDRPHKFPALPDDRYIDLIKRYDLVIFDEAHHLRGDSWHKVMMDFRARYRLGLSATVYFDDKREQERGVIWLKACCGDIKHEVSTSRLIEEGYLMRQEVELYMCTEPKMKGEKWSGALRAACITNNPVRNEMIAKLAQEKLDSELNVLIVTNRLAQIEKLSALLDKRGIEHVVITGKHSSEEREELIRLFRKGHVSCMLGTVFAEGVDVPEIEVVINAEGGRDAKATVQRMRNMTMSEGKSRSVLIDFWDDTNEYFKRHSRARLKTYESESAFQIRKMWLESSLRLPLPEL